MKAVKQNLGRWFRFYESTLTDAKALKLTDSQFRMWVYILCLTSREHGVIPPIDDICAVLRMKDRDVRGAITALIEKGLIDEIDGGLVPHNWDSRQFASDTSTERVQRFRERHETFQKRAAETKVKRFDSASESVYDSSCQEVESLSGTLKGAHRLRQTGAVQ